MRNLVLLATGLLMSGSLFANGAQPAAMQQPSAPAMQGTESITLPPPPAAFCKAYPDEKVCQQQPADMQQPATMPANNAQPVAMPENNVQPAQPAATPAANNMQPAAMPAQQM